MKKNLMNESKKAHNVAIQTNPQQEKPEIFELGEVTKLTGRKGRQYRDGRKNDERQ